MSRYAFFAVHGALLLIALITGLQNLFSWLFFLLVLTSACIGIYDMQ